MKRKIAFLSTLFWGLNLTFLPTWGSAFGGGTGTEQDPYQLSTPEHLTQLQVAVDGGDTFSGKYFALTNDINLEGYDNDAEDSNGNFEPIGSYNSRDDNVSFSGVLNGRGYSISNLKILLPNESVIGLFTHLNNKAEVTNLTIENVVVEGHGSVGTLAGIVIDSNIKDITISGNVKGGGTDIGGVIGFLSGSVVENLSVLGDIIGENMTGGLIGEIDDAEVSNSTFSGEITGGYATGGLVGFSWMATITDSYSFAKVVGDEYAGGLGGEIYSSKVERFGFCGSVKGDEMLGGIAGLIDDSSFLDVYVRGDVVGGVTVGGLVAESWSQSLIERGYHVGSVKGTNRVGRLGGWQERGSKIKKFYYNSEENVSLPVIGAGGLTAVLEDVSGLTTEQMTNGDAKNYMKFLDFDEAWQITSTTPMFKWQKGLISATQGQVQIEGKAEALIASVTVPTANLNFTIDPNQEAGKQFIASQFEVINESPAPITLTLKAFEQITDLLNDVLPTEHADWSILGKKESQDIALGIKVIDQTEWLELMKEEHYVAEAGNTLLGTLTPNSTVRFGLIAHHGTSFAESLNATYRLSFVFDLK